MYNYMYIVSTRDLSCHCDAVVPECHYILPGVFYLVCCTGCVVPGVLYPMYCTMCVGVFQDESQDYVASMWRRVALMSKHSAEQLLSYQNAIEALSVSWLTFCPIC